MYTFFYSREQHEIDICDGESKLPKIDGKEYTECSDTGISNFDDAVVVATSSGSRFPYGRFMAGYGSST